MDSIWYRKTPLGTVEIASDGNALTGLWFTDQKYFESTLDPDYEEKEVPVIQEAEEWLDQYFSGRDPGFTPALKLKGTEFQKIIWKKLMEIPYGETRTYAWLAGKEKARAAGSAVSHNPVSLIVPCHRIIGADGSLTGYAGGAERKKALLELEWKKVLR